MVRTWFLFVTLGALAAFVSPVAADVIRKNDGGKVSGTIIADESGATHVTIKTRFGKMKIAQNEIKEIQYSAAPVEEYKDEVKKYKDTADDQYRLALWCMENRYRKEYLQHLQRVIELDPNHAEARKRLGYRQINGKWMTRDDLMVAQGFVRHEGKWMLPQAIEQAEATSDQRKTRQEHYKNIKMWQKWLRQEKGDHPAEARKALLALRDPLAVKPLIEVLGDKGNDQDRRLLSDVLEKIKTDESTSGLVKIALNDKVDENRGAATQALRKRKSPPLLHEVVKYLKDNDNDKVCRAAAILGEMGDSSVYVAMVDALVTIHRHVTEPNVLEIAQRASGGFVPTVRTRVLADGTMVRPPVIANNATVGGGAMVQNTGPQMTIEEKKNTEVLDALTKLTGENYGFNKARWLRWIKENERTQSAKITK